ncbi:DUF4402 domain-containing protein [Sphingoaurantiacus capsulatus]|uniref:DUF4402 domain-containing protein n=1 Tax=Sphingoaurantiacus capsulatus TaxID=1771310 RepID=A0ABV7X6U7_9SPHN
MNKIAFAAAVAMAATSGAAFAQASATQSTTSTGRVVQAITLTKNTDIAFGSVVRSAAVGTNTVTIDATSGARAISGAGGGALATSTSGRATYTVDGEGAQTFSVSVPGTFNMTRSGGAETITVTPTTSAATGTISGTLGSAGTATFGVGGSFPVTNATVTGNYTGNFDVTVAYN